MVFKHKQVVLKNGLSLLTVPMKEAKSVTALLGVRVGSRDEEEKVNGISHFLEHMVFKATKKWPSAMEMNKVIDSIGGVFNAFTSKEYTGFWVKVHKKHLRLGLEFLQQAVFEPLLPAEELERERGVILEEIKMREDSPMTCVYDEFVSQVYSKTLLGQKVIGVEENIRRLKRKEFYNHLSRWYQAGNMILGVAGGMKEAEAKETVGEIFKGEKRGEISFKDEPERVKLDQKSPVVQVKKKEIKQAHFCLGLETFKREDKDRYALGVLKTILGGNTSSRLWNEIREKRGLVYYVSCSGGSFYESGYLLTQAGCDVKRIEEAIKVTLGEYEKIGKVREEELKLAKEFLKGRLALSLEDSQEVAWLVSEDLLLEGKVRTVEEIEEGINRVTGEDVKRVAERIFKEKKLNLTVLGPFKDRARFEKLI